MIATDFQCTVCGFIYTHDGRTSQSDRFLPFELLPENWSCPACGVLKNLFKEITYDGQEKPIDQHNKKTELEK